MQLDRKLHAQADVEGLEFISESCLCDIGVHITLQDASI